MKLSRFELSDFAQVDELAAQVRALSPAGERLSTEVAATIGAVRAGGDEALLELGERFDGVRPDSLRISPEQAGEALARVPADLRSALEVAAVNIGAVAEAQLRDGADLTLPQGQTIETGEVPVGSAGVYAPGGRGAYPSTVLMCAVPARVAGVGRIVVTTPPSASGAVADVTLAACAIAGVDEIFATGGAQAIAALAWGTESIAKVDVIVGPGSGYVQEAKLAASRVVGIDGYAGPSELMVLLDSDSGSTQQIESFALDLCAQAEHGDDGLLVLVGQDPELLDRVIVRTEELAADRPSVTNAPLASVLISDAELGVALANAIAPEHLEIAGADGEAIASRVVAAGCIFVGAGGATAFGDYAAGSNHVLPTGGAGRFTGPLSPRSFRRSRSVVRMDAAAAAALAPTVAAIAGAEGFPVHGESAIARAGSQPPVVEEGT